MTPSPEPHPPTTSTEGVVREFLDHVIRGGDTTLMDRYVAAGYVDRDPFPGQPPGRDGLRFEVETMKSGLPQDTQQLVAQLGFPSP